MLPLCLLESSRVEHYTSQGKDRFLLYPETIYCTQAENLTVYLSTRMTSVLGYADFVNLRALFFWKNILIAVSKRRNIKLIFK